MLSPFNAEESEAIGRAFNQDQAGISYLYSYLNRTILSNAMNACKSSGDQADKLAGLAIAVEELLSLISGAGISEGKKDKLASRDPMSMGPPGGAGHFV